MEIKIQKAERRKSRMRIEIASASGNGKTYSSLLLAKGLAGGDLSKVCMIDTENGSGNLYSHLGDYSVIEIDPEEATTPNILAAFQAAENAGFEVIIFDSSSHWREALLKHNEAEAQKAYGNSFRAWGKTTPLYDKLINHMLASPAHVIMTARKKIDYALETNDQGKAVVKKVGMKDVQRDTAMYEFGIVFDLDEFHQAKASKDRTGMFDGIDAFVITEDTGKQIRDWCESGAEVKPELKSKEVKIEKATPDPTLPHISDERFAKACDVISKGEATVESLLEHFTLTQNQQNIIDELFLKEAK